MNRLMKVVFAAPAAIVLLSTLTSSVVSAQTIAAGYPRTPWAGSCKLVAGAGTLINATCNIIAVPGAEIVVETMTVIAVSDVSHDNVLLQMITTAGGGINSIGITRYTGPPISTRVFIRTTGPNPSRCT